jgi:chorismate dehydratase
VPTVGAVPWLNAVPLVAGLPPEVRVRAAPPPVVSSWLEAGTVDAAILPVAESFRGVGGPFVGRFGIGCDGAVASVLAFHPRPGPPASWPQRVVLDPASRTSAALLRILLVRRHGLRPDFETAAVAGPDPAARPDAMTLVIGDPALALRRTWRGGILDLGEAWNSWTGLPFVFARWTARRGAGPQEVAALARVLDAAAERGLARLEEIGREHGPRHGLAPEEAGSYLRTSLRFDLDARAEAGLSRFRDETALLGLA